MWSVSGDVRRMYAGEKTGLNMMYLSSEYASRFFVRGGQHDDFRRVLPPGDAGASAAAGCLPRPRGAFVAGEGGGRLLAGHQAEDNDRQK